MKEPLIKFKTSIIAREKGFNLPCEIEDSDELSYFKDFNIPTQSLLQKWLREKHNIHLSIDTCINGYICYLKKREIGKLVKRGNEFWVIGDKNPPKTYEESLEIGLQTALNLIEI